MIELLLGFSLLFLIIVLIIYVSLDKQNKKLQKDLYEDLSNNYNALLDKSLLVANMNVTLSTEYREALTDLDKLKFENSELIKDNNQLSLKSAHIKKQKQAIKVLQSNNIKLFNLISNLLINQNEKKSTNEIELLISNSLFTSSFTGKESIKS